MSDIFANKIRSFNLYQMPLIQYTHPLKHLGNDSGNRRLPGSGITLEHHMIHLSSGMQPSFRSHRSDLQQSKNLKHKLLDMIEPDQPVHFLLQLGKQSLLLY
ncbi:hypothetical protein D3C81_1747180 [compost metagenome]